MKPTLTLAWLFAAAIGCGGKDKPAPTTTQTQTQTHEHHEGSGEAEHHANLPPELKAFHDLLAPRWHAEKGQQRITDTCAARDELKAAADAVAKATPPVATNADTWTNATRALVAAVDDLIQVCTVKGANDFEAVFAKVHDAFHALLAQTEAKPQ